LPEVEEVPQIKPMNHTSSKRTTDTAIKYGNQNPIPSAICVPKSLELNKTVLFQNDVGIAGSIMIRKKVTNLARIKLKSYKFVML
jgi:hypothetical protein